MKIKSLTFFPLFLLLILIFLIPTSTYANDLGTGFILGFFKDRLVDILTGPVAGLLNSVMSYNDFFSAGVDIGWDATRNFANLFFALILLFIAIATVLNIGALDNYTAKRMLPSFIFAALFINFSKAIVGFLVDISQIIMITFYNTFASDLTNTIGSASKLSESASAASGINPATINLLALVLVVLLIFIFLWTSVILAIRIVTIWFLIIFSPLAFISFIIPPLKSLGNSWSQQLQSALVTGPVLMFYLYIAFIIMTTDIASSGASSDNLFQNGNLIQFVLVIGLLVLANIEAQKAGNSAPGIVKNAVGVAGTVATFGLGAWVGAGGYGPRQMLKKGIELGDKGIGGVTRGAQVLSGGKIKANSAYEATKKDMAATNAAGKGLFGGVGQQFSQAGRENQNKEYELQQAKAYAKEGTIDDPTKQRYKKALNANMAEIASEIKDATSAEELGKQYAKALKDGEIGAAATIATKISSLENGWNRAMTNDDDIFKEARQKEGPEEQMRYIFDTSFEGMDQKTSFIRELKSRMTTNLKTQGQGGFADGLTSGGESVSAKAVAGGLTGVSSAYAKNKGILNRRQKTRDATTGVETFVTKADGTPVYEKDPEKVYNMVINEGNNDSLRDYKTWNAFGAQDRTEYRKILTDIKNGVYAAEIPTPDISKINAALKGLGSSASSRVTGDTI